MKLSNISSTFAIVVPLFSICFSWQANSIAKDMRDAARDGNAIDRGSHSYEIVEAAYKDIYDNGVNQSVRDKIQNKDPVQSQSNLLRFVDIFEGLGADYCNGLVYREHIQPKLSYGLGHICSNDQVMVEFAGKKNGLAMLCAEFLQHSKFASTLKRDHLDSCHFLDSKVFK